MDDLTLAFCDFDAAIERFKRSPLDADEVRRAINEALGYLYSIEQQRKLAPGFWTRLENHADGKVSAGLTFIRGRAVHHLVTAHEFEITVPSETLAPSRYLAPGSNWWWIDWDDLDAMVPLLPGGRNHHPQRREYVRDHVAGHLVLETFARARSFLATA